MRRPNLTGVGRACRSGGPSGALLPRSPGGAPAPHALVPSGQAPARKKQCTRCGQQGQPKSAHRLSAGSRLRENTPAVTLPVHTQDHRRTEQSSGGRSGLHGWRTLAKSQKHSRPPRPCVGTARNTDQIEAPTLRSYTIAPSGLGRLPATGAARVDEALTCPHAWATPARPGRPCTEASWARGQGAPRAPGRLPGQAAPGGGSAVC